jgi:uncharacterized protein YggE
MNLEGMDMRKALLAALAAGAATLSGAAAAQQPATITQTIAGTRLDISATGDVTRVPDLAIISAGVQTRSATASGAIQQAATRMARVRKALTDAGVADRDIQTSTISLNPEYTYANNQPPKLNGYTASNQLSVRFRDIANAGKILDALVSQGANTINGPTLTIDKPESALDEARARAVTAGRARAELYARSLGMRIVRLVSVSESSSSFPMPPPMPMYARAEVAQAADSKIDPGEQKLQVNVAMTFELQYFKRPRGSPARPSLISLGSRLADRASADQVDDREKNDRSKQRIEERFDRDRLIDAAAEQKPGDDRSDDADDDVEDDALLSVGSHDEARKPATNTANDQPDDNSHELCPSCFAPSLGLTAFRHHRRVTRRGCSGFGRFCPVLWLSRGDQPRQTRGRTAPVTSPGQ